MRLLDRYFTSEFLKVFLFALVGFTLMVSVMNVLEILKIETRQDRIHIYLYLLYTVPNVLAQVLPASLLFGVCFSVSQFEQTRELVAIQSAGISFYRAIVSVFITGALMTLFLFFFQNLVVSPANEAALMEKSIIKKDSGTVKDIIWQKNMRGKEGYYFIYYFDRKMKRILGGFNYLKMRDETTPEMMIQANKALYDPRTGSWTLKKVSIVSIAPDMRHIGVEKMEDLEIRFPEPIRFFENPSRDPSELNVFELEEEIARRRELGFSVSQYRVQYHASLSFPFMCLIVTLVGAIVGGMGSHRSTGPLVRSILISVATMFIYILVYNLGKNLGNTGVLSPITAGWGPTVIFLLIGLVLVARNRK